MSSWRSTVLALCLQGSAAVAAEGDAPVEQRLLRVGLSASGVLAPFPSLPGWGFAGDLVLVVAPAPSFDVRLVVSFTHTLGVDAVQHQNQLVLGAEGTAWFGDYGVGVLAGGGYVGVNLVSSVPGGPSFIDGPLVLVGATPVRYRFGGSLVGDVFLDLGAIFFFAPPAPQGQAFGRLGVSVYF
jgi:hypothetical protein